MFCLVLTSFYWVLLGFTGFYLVLLSLTCFFFSIFDRVVGATGWSEARGRWLRPFFQSSLVPSFLLFPHRTPRPSPWPWRLVTEFFFFTEFSFPLSLSARHSIGAGLGNDVEETRRKFDVRVAVCYDLPSFFFYWVFLFFSVAVDGVADEDEQRR